MSENTELESFELGCPLRRTDMLIPPLPHTPHTWENYPSQKLCNSDNVFCNNCAFMASQICEARYDMLQTTNEMCAIYFNIFTFGIALKSAKTVELTHIGILA